jgi:hypothetical protein
LLKDIRQHIKHVEKAVSTKEPRFMSRALRAIVTLRKKLNDSILRKAIFVFLPSTSTPAQKNALLEHLEEVCYFVMLSALFTFNVFDFVMLRFYVIRTNN